MQIIVMPYNLLLLLVRGLYRIRYTNYIAGLKRCVILYQLHGVYTPSLWNFQLEPCFV